MSPLYKIINLEHTSQFKLVKGPNSNRMNVLFLKKTIPVTLYNNCLTFRDAVKEFEIQGNLGKNINNKNYNVDFPLLPDKNTMYDSAKEKYSDEKALGIKITRDTTLRRSFKSLGIMVSASGVSSSHKKKTFSKTRFLSSDPNELCDRLKL